MAASKTSHSMSPDSKSFTTSSMSLYTHAHTQTHAHTHARTHTHTHTHTHNTVGTPRVSGPKTEEKKKRPFIEAKETYFRGKRDLF